jgi:hypothetical protein
MARKPNNLDFQITNERAAAFLKAKGELKILESRTEYLKIEIAEKEQQFIKAMRLKNIAGDLKFDLEIMTKKGRYPKWKEAFIDKLGEIEANKVFNKTKQTIHKHVLVRKKVKVTIVD